MSSPTDVVLKYIRKGELLGGRYEIESFVGSGAYGAIFSAIDRSTLERVAIKAIPPADDAVNQTAVGRFHREMKVIRSLRHPNIITLYDYGETDDRIVYMVLEFIDGITLHDLVTGRRLTTEEKVSLTRQIALGLQEAHRNGVVHRDLKPQNIMIVEPRPGVFELKILDFGMAKLLAKLGDESIVKLTREGVAVGTPRYIAPEQARGKEVGPYTDLYALGLLLYEIFTGERVVKDDAIDDAIRAHVTSKPHELPRIDEIPEGIRPVLLRLVEKNHKKRYQEAAEVLDDLHRADAAQAGPWGPPAAPVAPEPARIHSMFSDDHPMAAASSGPRERRADAQPAPSPTPAPTPSRATGSAPPPPATRSHVVDRRPPGSASTRRAPAGIRTPSTTAEWLETVAAFILAPMSFILLSAPLEGLSPLLRAVIGALPLLIGLGAGILLDDGGWRKSIFRLVLLSSVLGVAAAHLLGPAALAVGLLREPAWFLTPLEGWPGVAALESMVTGLARIHAALLVSLSEAVATKVQSAGF